MNLFMFVEICSVIIIVFKNTYSSIFINKYSIIMNKLTNLWIYNKIRIIIEFWLKLFGQYLQEWIYSRILVVYI